MGESIPGLLHWTEAFKLFPNALIIPHAGELAGAEIATMTNANCGVANCTP